MELHSHVTHVQEQLEAAAALGDERTQQTASALATAAAPAMRLAILSAVSAAAAEITAALLDSPGAPAVSVHLDGDDLRVEVRSGAEQPPATQADEGDASARISLRLSEALKSDIEGAARNESISVNSWLVRAATHALAVSWGSWGSRGQGMRFDPRRGSAQPGGSGNPHHITGWING